MAKGLTNATDKIQDLLLAEFTAGNPPELKQAPDEPPESLVAFPFSIVYPLRAQPSSYANGYMKTLYTLAVEIHLARGILPHQVALAKNMLPRAQKIFIVHPTLEDTVDTILNAPGDILVRFGRFSYGGSKDVHIGFRIEATVKITETVTVATNG